MNVTTFPSTLPCHLLLFLVFLPVEQLRCDDATPVSPTATNNAVQTVSEVALTLIDNLRLPSMSVAVAIRDRLIWSEAFGYADLENRVAASPTSKYRIGSVSKSLTSFAIGALVEQGVLDIDASISKYLPLYPETPWPLTTRQLASHTAGIRNYKGDEFLSSTAYTSVQETLSIFSHDPLNFEPGTQYLYSTYGWSIISAIIESAAHADFRTFMKRSVLEPIGMHHTVAEEMRPLIEDRVGYYEWDETGKLQNAPYVDTSNKWAGGGYLSTPEDIARFGIEFLHGSLLSASTRTTLTERQQLTSGTAVEYGLGWELRTDPHGNRVVGHSGGSIGGTTMFFIWPSTDLIVVVTSNITDDPGLRLVTYAIGEVFMRSTGNFDGTESDCQSVVPGIDKDNELNGTIRLRKTGSQISGVVTVEPIVSSGEIILGWTENGSKHLVIAARNEVFHGCLRSNGSSMVGFLVNANGSAYSVSLKSLP